jgi:hypothetical protein
MIDEKADPFGMTARKARATATAKATAIAMATATAKAKCGGSSLRSE